MNSEKLSSYNGGNQSNIVAKCAEWLEKTSFIEDDESICTDISDCSTSSSDPERSTSTVDCYIGNSDLYLNDEVSNEELQTIITQTQNVYTNVNVTKSKNVHLGNVVYINGPVHINQTSTIINNQTTINQFVNADDGDDSRPPYIISRTYWLAQPPMGRYTYLKLPAKYVIISHSASEEGLTLPANTLLVRLIQQFHIESRNFDDIAYNFLIGADGNIYEGRGWTVVGAHSQGFNRMSVGICFIGCFTMKAPSPTAIRKAKRLIAYGVEKGYIDKQYSVLGHCQCTTTESPGRILFEELKTWERFDSNISVNTPPPLVDCQPFM